MGRFVNYFSVNEFYHLYNRGIEKRKIFLNNKDENRFLMLLYLCNTVGKIHLSDLSKKTSSHILSIPRDETLVDIGAYCLMPNHFHLLVKEKREGGISIFMQKLLTAYTMYFNKKYSRSGALFQGTFKAEHCNNDNYLKYLFSYIHLNPVKLVEKNWREEGIKNISEIKKFLSLYKKSSYLDYLETERIENTILNMAEFPQYFEKTGDFESFIDLWLNYKDQLTIHVKV